ncbi:MAG: hypothetical protein GX558_01475, partial [Clostridiales bacterium]|nr:hypothetical protein [Clostridiales bacterium]
MKKPTALVLLAAMALTMFAFIPAFAGEASAEVVHIVYFNNSGKLGGTGLAGSNEADYAMVHDLILKETGIDVEVIVPPVGSEGDKLNTLLASQTPLDLFYGSWGKYVDAIQPITEPMNNYGQHIIAAWPEEAINGMKRGDDYMGTMRNTPMAPYPIWLRTDWLEKCNLQFPTTID